MSTSLRSAMVRWSKEPLVRFRAGFFSALAVSMLLMLNDSTTGAGLVMAALTTVLGLASAGFMQWRYGSMHTGILVDGGAHPSLGLLVYVAVTPRQIAFRVMVYLIAACASAWVMVHGLPGPPDVFINIFGAALLAATPGWLMAELVATAIVRRWGASPPRHVALGYLVAGAGLMLISGALVARACITFLEAEFPDFYFEWLMWTPVGWAAFLVLATWMRDVVVSKYQARLDAQTEALKEAERARKLAEAQLAVLQAQIEPHFLYNTLASVQYLVRKDASSADFLLTHLIRYLRHAMPKMRQPLSTLEQEFELADAFLQIARMRMGGRLTVKVELQDELHAIPFPPLVLQTLVENALKHGVEPKLGPVDITVQAEVENDNVGRPLLVLEVIDTGVGLGKPSTAGSGSGLANIRERLAGIYGERASLVVSDRPGGGVVSQVTLALPDIPASLMPLPSVDAAT